MTNSSLALIPTQFLAGSISDLVESLLRPAAAAFGLLAISLPLLRVWRGRHIQRGRSSGTFTTLTRWPAIFAVAAAYIAIGALLWKPVLLTWSSELRLILILMGALLYFPGIFLYIWGVPDSGTDVRRFQRNGITTL